MRAQRAQILIGRIGYLPNYRISIPVQHTLHESELVMLEVEFDRPDAITHEMGVGRVTRSLNITNMGDGQFLQFVFGTLSDIAEHEAREAFTYRGSQIFGPHMEPEALREADMMSKSLQSQRLRDELAE